jgi:hypothetical protein
MKFSVKKIFFSVISPELLNIVVVQPTSNNKMHRISQGSSQQPFHELSETLGNWRNLHVAPVAYIRIFQAFFNRSLKTWSKNKS